MTAEVFRALGDPVRHQVVETLSAGASTATQLARGLPISRQAVAKHLGVLEDAGLVASARSGREVRYSLDADSLTDAASWLADVGAAWDSRLARLRDLVDGER